jgi:hypothetical protein
MQSGMLDRTIRIRDSDIQGYGRSIRPLKRIFNAKYTRKTFGLQEEFPGPWGRGMHNLLFVILNP